MQKAKAAGGHIEIDPQASFLGIAIVAVPTSAADYVTTLSGQRPRYALVVTLQGPIASYIVDNSGKKLQLLGQTATGVTFRQAVFGQYQNGSLGPIWFQLAFGDCSSAWMAGTCAL